MEINRCIFKFFINPKDSRLNIKKIIEYSNLISNHFNVEYSELSYCFNENNKNKTKVYKYTTNNLEKLLNNKGNITAVSFEKLKQAQNYSNTDISINFLLSQKMDYPTTINISIDSQIFMETGGVTKLTELITKTIGFGFKLEYGIVHIMEEEKQPMFFLIGIKSPKLTMEERNIADALCLNIRDYKNKIWDIFWLNIIDKEIIQEDMIEEIKEVVGEEGLIDAGDKYIISLPFDYKQCIEKKDSVMILKNKLRQIFLHNEKIMYK